jgi:hypothetical protein
MFNPSSLQMTTALVIFQKNQLSHSHFFFFFFKFNFTGFIFTHMCICCNLFCHLVLQFCWRENIRYNKKDIVLLLVWDKDSYTEKSLALLSCTDVLQPTLVHLYQTSSLLLSPLPIVASASLRLLYLLLYSEHINHIQVLGFLPFSLFLPFTFSP